MSPAAPFDAHAGNLPSVVVVDPEFSSYATLAASARLGNLQLHLRSAGTDAIRLSRRIHVDAWIVAAELDDMSGHDLVELLKSECSDIPVAMVVDAARGRRNTVDTAAATEVGADVALSHPISLADLERLLGLPSEDLAREFGSNGSKPFVTLPVGIGAAVIAIAVLMIG
jgi:CheY-like chemotaxis protein